MTLRALSGLATLNLAYTVVGLALLWSFGALRTWNAVARLVGLGYLVGLAAFGVLWTTLLVLGVPFDGMTIVVSSIHIDNEGVAKITWSDARNTAEPAAGTTVTLPSGLVRNNTYLIMAEVHYAYTPTFGEVLTGVIDLGEIFYLRPREGTQVARIN